MVEQQRNPVISQSKAPEILSSILTVLNMKQEVASTNSCVGVFQSQHPRQHFDNFFASSKTSKLDAASASAFVDCKLLPQSGSNSSPSLLAAAPVAAAHSGAVVGASSSPPPPLASSSSSSSSPPPSTAEAPKLLPFLPVDEGSRGLHQNEEFNADDDNNNNNNCIFDSPAGLRYDYEHDKA